MLEQKKYEEERHNHHHHDHDDDYEHKGEKLHHCHDSSGSKRGMNSSERWERKEKKYKEKEAEKKLRKIQMRNPSALMLQKKKSASPVKNEFKKGVTFKIKRKTTIVNSPAPRL